MISIVPERSLMHCIALLPDKAEPRRFFELLRGRRAGAKPGKEWVALKQPRPCVFGEVSEGEWAWRVIIDPDVVPGASWKAGFGDAPAPQHKAHAFVFLTSAPQSASGLDRVRATLQVAWAWLDAGATAMAFPAAGIADGAKALAAVDPATLDADRAAALLTSLAAMGLGSDGRFWLRTRGLSHFGLADLACALSGAKPNDEEVQAAQALFASLAPYVIARDAMIGVGETAEIGGRTWEATGESEAKKAPPHVGTLQVFGRVGPVAR